MSIWKSQDWHPGTRIGISIDSSNIFWIEKLDFHVKIENVLYYIELYYKILWMFFVLDFTK